MKDLIHVNTTKCPYCDYTTNNFVEFQCVHYEGGSGGLRTFRCPNCGKEVGE